MNEQTYSHNGEGIGFTGVLTIVFIVLKLTNVISWSWWWVLSPAWITMGLALFLIALVVFVEVIRAFRG